MIKTATPCELEISNFEIHIIYDHYQIFFKPTLSLIKNTF